MRAYAMRSPWESNQERMVSDALESSQESEAQIEQIRPPLAQIREMPPRFGYPSYAQRQPGVLDILQVDRLYGDQKDAISGGPGGYQAASRNVQSDFNY